MRNVLSRMVWMQTTMMVEIMVFMSREKATPPAMVGIPRLDLKFNREVNCMYAEGGGGIGG